MSNEKKRSVRSEAETLERYKQKIMGAAYRDHAQLKKYLHEMLALPYANKPEHARSVVYVYQVYLNVMLLECDYVNVLGGMRRYFELAAPLLHSYPVIYYQYVGGLSCWLGILFNNTDFYRKSIFYCNLALNELRQQNTHTDVEYIRIAWCYQHLGKNYVELGNFKEAMRCLDAAILWQNFCKETMRPSYPYVARAYVNISQKRYVEAMQDFKVLEARTTLPPNLQSEFLGMQGEVALEYDKNPQAALVFYHKALQLAEQLAFRQNIADMLLKMVQCYEQLGDIEQALNMYRKYADVKNTHAKSLQQGYAHFIEQMFAELSLSIAVGEKTIPTSFESFWSQKIDSQSHEGDEQGAMAILNCIMDNLSLEQLDAAWLAKELYTSERSLHRKIVQLYNMPPKKLIQTVRLQTAKTMLERHFVDVSTVSMEVGFKSPTYFSKAFKRVYGISPYDIQQAPPE